MKFNSRLEILRERLKRTAERAAAIESEINRVVELEARQAAVRLAEGAAKGEARALARQWSIQIDDETKEFDRISVWPAQIEHDEADIAIEDQFEGDHYVYSWVEALKRVEAYAEAYGKLNTL